MGSRHGGCLAAVLTVFLYSLCVSARTLVLLDSLDVQYTHSLFFVDLRQAGHDLEFRSASDDKLRLQSYGEWMYDNIVFFSRTSKALGGAVDVQYLTQFVDSGRNILIASDAGASDAARQLASELGIDFLDSSARVTDHASHAREHGPADVLTDAFALPAITGAGAGPIRYRGGGLSTPADSVMTFPAVLAPATAQLTQRVPNLAGSAIALAVAMQARNNARVLVTASAAMFSDDFLTTPVTHALTGSTLTPGNRALCRDLAAWAFQQKGMLRMTNFRHHRAAEPLAPFMNTYTIKDTIVVEMDLHELVAGEWVPHATDAALLQYVMLDPYVRQHMAHEGQGHYALTVKAPDAYGVFKWVLDVRQKGYSLVHHEEVAPLRPYRHDEYPRFVVQAYPYYASIIALSIAFFTLITLVMFHQDKPVGQAAKSM